jgi:hypothetical protein
MRRRKLVGLLAAIALVSASAFVLWPRPPRVTRQNCSRLQYGMDRKEVETILGPPGDHTTRPVTGVSGHQIVLFWREGARPRGTPLTWRADTGSVSVTMSQLTDRLEVAKFQEVDCENQSFLDNLLWRAKRQWRKWLPE